MAERWPRCGKSLRGVWECGSEGWRSGGGEDDPETIPFQISHRDLLALLLPKMRRVMKDVKAMETVALELWKPACPPGADEKSV